jgi:aminoglycoside phosphotransferase (APT) family kinase protein
LWQLGLKGARLDVGNTTALKSAAEALVWLHTSHLSGLPAYPHASSRLDEAAAVIAAAAPDQRDSILSLIDRLQALRPHLEARPAVALHGDLHLQNFIVTAQGTGLIDLDTLAAGDPVEDLASFAAALYGAGLAGGVPEDDTRRYVANFIAAYELCGGWQIPPRDLNWHIAAALITERALRAVTRMKPDLPTPEALLHLASCFVAAAGQAKAGMEAFA